MLFSFAPMQGLTTDILRCEHHSCFPGMDDYYTPFLAAHQTMHFKKREIKDILPRNNAGVPTVVQVLGNRADLVAWSSAEISGYGWRELNLNLGCSMPTVAKRGKGAGFLNDPDLLDRFFEELFDCLEKRYGMKALRGSQLPDGNFLHFSVKTRIGTLDASQAGDLIQVYNRYPLSRVIIHPRTARDLYSGRPDLDTFRMMLEESVHPVCYNSDINSREDYQIFTEQFPSVGEMMIGRGLIRNPALVRELQGGKELTVEEARQYLGKIYRHYLEEYPDSRQAVDKMKGIWHYHGSWYSGREKELKAIQKARTAGDYEEAVMRIWD